MTYEQRGLVVVGVDGTAEGDALQRVPPPPDVEVSTKVVEGTAGPALVEAARTARLLVVEAGHWAPCGPPCSGRSAGTAPTTRPVRSSWSPRRSRRPSTARGSRNLREPRRRHDQPSLEGREPAA